MLEKNDPLMWILTAFERSNKLEWYDVAENEEEVLEDIDSLGNSADEYEVGLD